MTEQDKGWEERFDEITTPPLFHPDFEGKDCIMCGWPMPNSRGIKMMKELFRKELAQAKYEGAKKMNEALYRTTCQGKKAEDDTSCPCLYAAHQVLSSTLESIAAEELRPKE